MVNLRKTASSFQPPATSFCLPESRYGFLNVSALLQKQIEEVRFYKTEARS
jgi:hypothetical protein